jgi:hypothetical protein
VTATPPSGSGHHSKRLSKQHKKIAAVSAAVYMEGDQTAAVKSAAILHLDIASTTPSSSGAHVYLHQAQSQQQKTPTPRLWVLDWCCDYYVMAVV